MRHCRRGALGEVFRSLKGRVEVSSWALLLLHSLPSYGISGLVISTNHDELSQAQSNRVDNYDQGKSFLFTS